MNLNHSKNRRLICLLLSTCLFVESGYAATGLNQGMIDEVKTFFNKTGMGKTQTIGEWYNRARAELPHDLVKKMDPWVQSNRNKKLPAFNAQIKNTKKLGKHVSITFMMDGKKTEWLLNRDEKGPVFSNGKHIAHQKELEEITFNNGNHLPSLSFKDFKTLATKNPKWGQTYIKNLRKFYADMEKYQPLFLSKKTKKTSLRFQKQNLLIEKAYAQESSEVPQNENDEQVTIDNITYKTCVVAGWTGVYDEPNGFCKKHPNDLRLPKAEPGELEPRISSDYKCEKDGEIDCNPYIYGFAEGATPTNPKRHCVSLKPKERVSRTCDSLATPIKNATDLKNMLSQVDKVVESKNDGDMLLNLREQIKTFRSWCLTKTQQDDKVKFPLLGQNDYEYKDSDFTAKFSEKEYKGNEAGQEGMGGNDSNFHNREACATMFNRLKFHDPSKEEGGGNGNKGPCDESIAGGGKTPGGNGAVVGKGSFETDKICKTDSILEGYLGNNNPPPKSNSFCTADDGGLSRPCTFITGLALGAGGALLICFLTKSCGSKNKTKEIIKTNEVIKTVPGETVIQRVEVPGKTIIEKVPYPVYIDRPKPPPPIDPPPVDPGGSEDVNPSGPNRPGPGGE